MRFMSLSFYELWLYGVAILILFLTPGPVWVAIIARALASGFHGIWPLALGVALGDFIWPLAAMAGMGVLTGLNAHFLDNLVLNYLAYIAAIIFFVMGFMLIRHADSQPARLTRLTRPSRQNFLAGFSAGALIIISNPKAILFYMGVLPGFFDLRAITLADALAVSFVSMGIPFCGNIMLGLMVGTSRSILDTPKNLKRLNITSGILLIGVGVAILFSKL